eukprot:924558-Prorocentrum_minimum.AAC.2
MRQELTIPNRKAASKEVLLGAVRCAQDGEKTAQIPRGRPVCTDWLMTLHILGAPCMQRPRCPRVVVFTAADSERAAHVALRVRARILA